MSVFPRPVTGRQEPRPRGLLSPLSRRVNRVVEWILIAAVGVLLGQQYVYPDKRMIPLIISAIVVGLAWRLDLLTGIGILVVALPYPRSTVFGTTNLAFVLMLVIFWLVRVSTRELAPPKASPIDLPILGLTIVYILSFNNVRGEQALDFAFRNFVLYIGSILMYFLITNNVHTEKDLKRLHDAQFVSALLIFLLGIWELNHPGQTFIPGWIGFQRTRGTDFNSLNVRIGSAFFDFELLSEFSAMMLLMALFRFVRASSNNERALYAAFSFLNVFILFATVTRGALVSLALALPVLLWNIRRRLRIVPVTIAVSAITATFLGMNFFVAHFTRSGDLFGRFASTRVVGGWMPDTRAHAWTNAWERALLHPWIGQGPYYGDIRGYDVMWPHNVYLYYANIVGFIGLAFFLLMLFRFLQLTRPRTDDLARGPYADSFLLIAQAQLVLFMVNEFKIDYLRNMIYQMEVWVFFSMWTAAYKVSRRENPTLAAPRR